MQRIFITVLELIPQHKQWLLSHAKGRDKNFIFLEEDEYNAYAKEHELIWVSVTLWPTFFPESGNVPVASIAGTS